MSELCSTEKCVAVVQAETKIANLEGWQKNQNGSIKIANEKIDRLMFLIIAQLCATVIGAAGIILVGK